MAHYKMWVNGILFAQNGEVGTNKETSTNQWLPLTKAFHLDTNRIEIVIQVSNFNHVYGGFYMSPKLGTYKNLSRWREVIVAVDLTIFGCLLLFGFVFLGMYLFWRNDKSLLYFSLFCLIISYRFIGSESYLIINVFPNAPFEIITKLEYISMYGGVAMILTFIAEVFPKAVYILAIRVFQYFSALIIIFTLIFPVSVYSYLAMPYQIVLLSYLFYGGFICIKAQQHYDGAIFAVISIILLLTTTAISSLSYLGVLPHFPFLFKIGFLIYVFSQTFILSGHGVPGAFMSIVGITLLNEIVELRKLYNPAEILENLHLGGHLSNKITVIIEMEWILVFACLKK